MAVGRLTGRRIALLARYSSDKQSETSNEAQIAQAARFVEQHGGVLDDRLVFADAAISGRVRARPGFQALMDAVRAGEVDIIVTEAVDRLGRDEGDLHELRRLCDFKRVSIVTMHDGVDTSQGSSGRLLFALRASMAATYSEDLAEKTHRGLVDRFERGLATGKLPYGYRTEPDPNGRRIVIDDEHVAVVKRIFAEYAAGGSLGKIAASLNEDGIAPPHGNGTRRVDGWGATSVRALLQNERYTGKWTWNARRFQRHCDTRKRVPRMRLPSEIFAAERPDLRIVDDETWRRVAARFAQHARQDRQGAGRRRYPLSGLLVCGVCGGPMTVHGGNPERRYYGCGRRRSRGNVLCTNKVNVLERTARDRIFDAIRHRLTRPAVIREMRAIAVDVLRNFGREADSEIEATRSRLDRCERRIGVITEKLSDGLDTPGMRRALLDREAEARDLRVKLAGLERAARAPLRLPSPDEIVTRALDVERLLQRDVDRGRAALGMLLEGGSIRLVPGEDGIYTAHVAVVVARLLGLEATAPSAGGPGMARFDSLSCGGRI